MQVDWALGLESESATLFTPFLSRVGHPGDPYTWIYGFDITKANKIFDLLLSEGLIKLKQYHKITSEEELKNMKYYKWHNATSHDTNECKVFR